MTNRDVINFLNQVRKMLLDDKSWLESTIQPINEAFDMAISALKKQTLPSAQPDVPNINVGDMISREELFEELNGINLPVGDEIVDKIFSVIENIPSAQPNKSDLIERQAAIDELISEPPEMNYGFYYAEKIKALPSAQPKQSDTSEFWRKRADYYSDMCMDLIGEMGKGVKIESVKISENGIEFIKEQPPAQPTLCGYDIEHLILIANVLKKENLPTERIIEALTDIGRIVSICKDEFEESLRKAVEQCKI